MLSVEVQWLVDKANMPECSGDKNEPRVVHQRLWRNLPSLLAKRGIEQHCIPRNKILHQQPIEAKPLCNIDTLPRQYSSRLPIQLDIRHIAVAKHKQGDVFAVNRLQFAHLGKTLFQLALVPDVILIGERRVFRARLSQQCAEVAASTKALIILTTYQVYIDAALRTYRIDLRLQHRRLRTICCEQDVDHLYASLRSATHRLRTASIAMTFVHQELSSRNLSGTENSRGPARAATRQSKSEHSWP